MLSNSRCRAAPSRISASRMSGGERRSNRSSRSAAAIPASCSRWALSSRSDRSISRHGTSSCGSTTCTGRLRPSCTKPLRRLWWRFTTACSDAASLVASSAPSSSKLKLHRIEVGPLRVVQRMEQQALLQRRQRQDVLEIGIGLLQPLDLGLRQRNQRQVARRPPAGASLRGVPTSAVSARNQVAARSRTAASPISAGAKLSRAESRGPSAPSSVSALISSGCASGIAGSPPPAPTSSPAGAQPPVAAPPRPRCRPRCRAGPDS